MVAICYVEAWEKLCIPMSAARSFPLSLRQAFRMGNNDRSKVIARRRTRTTEKKTKNSVFMRAGSSYGDTKKRPDDFTISFTVFFFFFFAEREQKMQGRYHSSCRRENTSEHLFNITVWEAKNRLPNHSYNAFAARKNVTSHVH